MKPRDQRWLVHVCGLVGAGGICGLLYLGLIMPLDTRRTQVREDRVAYEQAKVELAATQRTMAGDQAAIVELERKLLSVVALQPQSRLNARLSEISAVLEAEGIAISSLRPEPPTSTAHYNATTIIAQAEGTSAQFVAMLEALHQQARDVEVRSFEVRTVSGTGVPKLDIRLALTWYAQPLEAKLPSVASERSEAGS
jgi:hypothetical protein